MLARLSFRVVQLALFLAASALTSGAALAGNVPGSAAAAVPELTEIATGMTIRSIKQDVREMRDGGAGLSISTSGKMDVSLSGGGGLPVALNFSFRDIESDRIDGGLSAASILFGHAAQPGLLLFGGLIAEGADVDTPHNTGTVKTRGLGLAVGADYRVSDRLVLTGILGAMSLDYDVSRSGGAITGSFDADRRFIDLSGDYMTRAGNADLLLGFGLLYVDQDNDGYTESGGAPVAAYSHSRLSGNLELRGIWGTGGDYRPYAEVSSRFVLSESGGLPAVLELPDDDWSARLGLGLLRDTTASGFDTGLGANFGAGGFEGLDAKLSYTLRF